MINRNPILLFIVLIGIVPVLSNCSFFEPKPHHAIGQEIKDYCVFKDGTRWIYQEEKSGELDTMTAFESVYIKEDWDNKGFTFDSYYFNLRSSLFKNDVKDFYRISVTLQLTANLEKFWCRVEDTSFYRPIEYFEANNTGENLQNAVKFFSFHDSLAIEGKQYYQVKVFEHLTNAGPKNSRKIYWSKHIGRIRYEFFNGEIWNLIEHKVIQ
jgi:hypothetical protein